MGVRIGLRHLGVDRLAARSRFRFCFSGFRTLCHRERPMERIIVVAPEARGLKRIIPSCEADLRKRTMSQRPKSRARRRSGGRRWKRKNGGERFVGPARASAGPAAPWPESARTLRRPGSPSSLHRRVSPQRVAARKLERFGASFGAKLYHLRKGEAANQVASVRMIVGPPCYSEVRVVLTGVRPRFLPP